MALKYLVDLNLSGNEIQNVALQTVAGTPTGLAIGHIVYDTLASQVKIYNGSEWAVVGLVADEASLTVSSGTISIKDGGVSTAKIANLAVSTAKIADDAVTYAKLQNVAANSLLGNNTGSATAAAALTATQVRTLINVADGANNYVLPTASAAVLGGIKVGTDLTIATGVLTIGSNVATLSGTQTFTGTKTFAEDTSFSKNVSIVGNLTVSGTVTSINTTDLDVKDKLITLNVGSTIAANSTGSGFQVTVDATSTAGIVWDNAASRFKHLNVAGGTNETYAYQSEIRTNEQIEDLVGAMFSGNTETGITVTYQDVDGTIDLVVAEQRTNEQVMDLVADVMVGNATHTAIRATDNDSGNGVNLVNGYNHRGVTVTGHAGGPYVIDLVTLDFDAAITAPLNVDVYETAATVRTMVLTAFSIDSATSVLSVELGAGDYFIAISGVRR